MLMRKLWSITACIVGYGAVFCALCHEGKAQTVREACAADVAKFCPDATDAQSRRQCRIAHRAELSEECVKARQAAGGTQGASPGSGCQAAGGAQGVSPGSGREVAPGWDRTFRAGFTDLAGRYIGGATIMHLVGHQGRLFAADSYWCDARNIWYGGQDPSTGWAQILRLDSPGGPWTVDLDLGPQFLRPEILKSITFHTDSAGHQLPAPANLLLTAAFSRSPERVEVYVFTRDDTAGNWAKTLIFTGPMSNTAGEDYAVRAMSTHRDKITGIDHIFLPIGNKGIFSGVYDPTVPGKIKWSPQSESGPAETRILSTIEANGSLVFSAGRKIYRRVDGPAPSYQVIQDMSDRYPEPIRSATGGIRGLTAIQNPVGKGDSLVFAMWEDRSRGDVWRLDPTSDEAYTRTHEITLADLVTQYLPGATVRTVGAAYSDFHAVTDPSSGETLHLVGLEAWLFGNRYPTWGGNGQGGFYAGALVAVRDAKGHYTMHEVNGRATPNKPPLVAAYSFAISPFASDHERTIYFSGLDANNRPATNLAWIFGTSLQSFLRATTTTPPGGDETPETAFRVPITEDRCGPGMHRGPYGGCRPLFSCPSGWHSGPYGYRCFPN
jgi:hypothetical protein